MKRCFALLIVLLAALVAGCAPDAAVCPAGSITYLDESGPGPAADLLQITGPTTLELGGKTIAVDQVVHGPVCNLKLSGSVYVACDIQIKKWEGKPNFLTGCDFQVEPGTVIYVAAHNNAAYYNGCVSCHAAKK